MRSTYILENICVYRAWLILTDPKLLIGLCFCHWERVYRGIKTSVSCFHALGCQGRVVGSSCERAGESTRKLRPIPRGEGGGYLGATYGCNQVWDPWSGRRNHRWAVWQGMSWDGILKAKLTHSWQISLLKVHCESIFYVERKTVSIYYDAS